MSNRQRGEASVKEVTIVGIDLAQRVFQLHGAAVDGSIALRKKLSPGAAAAVFGSAAGLYRGHGGLRDRAGAVRSRSSDMAFA
jgi:hypothetical protein